MRHRFVPILLSAAIVGALPAGTITQSPIPDPDLPFDESASEQDADVGFPGDVVACDELTCPPHVSAVVGSYGPTNVSTAGATTNYASFLLGSFQAGTNVRVATCGMAETAFTRNTFLRLFIAGTSTEVASNDDNCAGRGSQINYVTPYDMTLELRAGCAGESVGCAGTIALVAHLDATPRPARVKLAFRRAANHGVLGVSPDIFTQIRGINYQNAGVGEKYHHQGIARTYLRSNYDLAWTTSVRDDAGPQFNNVFFTRMGTRTSTLVQRFGGNVTTTAIDISVSPPKYNYHGSPLDAVIYGSNAGVYDQFNPGDPADWDGVPVGRRFDHGGGIQAIGRYVVATSEFVSVPCTQNPFGLDDCPDHGDKNLPPSGQASQVVLYDVAVPEPQPQLLIARKGKGSGWVSIAKLGDAHAPPVLRNGYLLMVADGNRLSLYAIPVDPCTGYVSLARVKPYGATSYELPLPLNPLAPRTCAGVRTVAHQAAAEVSQVSYVGCVRRVIQRTPPANDPACPHLVTMYADGSYIDFSNQDDVQSANFVTQANGQLYLVAFVGYLVDAGPNSEGQLWRVVFGAASGASTTQRLLPDGRECQPFLCLIRDGTEDARDSYKNMQTTGISGRMFRYGGGGYIVPSGNPDRETFFFYGTEHYLQKGPRAALFNEF